MARIFITGSSAGLGLLAGQHLAERGHQVVLHARTEAKAMEIRRAVPNLAGVTVGDLEHIGDMRAIASAANAYGQFDAVIHNAGVGDSGGKLTNDGLPVVFAVNALAPYVLTSMMARPKRLIYLSSNMHFGAVPAKLSKFWQDGRWHGAINYSNTKFLDTTLAFAVARLWPETLSNAVDPGWVPTRMGGVSAPDDLTEGYLSQTWLAEASDEKTHVTGQYIRRKSIVSADPHAREGAVQEAFLALCASITGLTFPRG